MILRILWFGVDLLWKISDLFGALASHSADTVWRVDEWQRKRNDSQVSCRK